MTPPPHCQFPDCYEPSRYVLTWYDAGPERTWRAAVCARHLPHAHILAPTRAIEAIEKEVTDHAL